MFALLKYLLGRLIELILIRWIVRQLLIACAWAGYDLATIASRRDLPTSAQVMVALRRQSFLLERRLQILKSTSLSDEKKEERVAALLADQREFRNVIRALRLAALIRRLKEEYERRGQ